jgi:hypothetical protein
MVRCRRGWSDIPKTSLGRANGWPYIQWSYILEALETLCGFDWDAANVGHILRHAVTPFEVKEVAGRPHVIIDAATA